MSLSEFRESKGFNQKEMAEMIGVSASYYYKVEANQRNPSFGFMKKLKIAFPEIVMDEMFFKQKNHK